jgi:hypothetical protein
MNSAISIEPPAASCGQVLASLMAVSMSFAVMKLKPTTGLAPPPLGRHELPELRACQLLAEYD